MIYMIIGVNFDQLIRNRYVTESTGLRIKRPSANGVNSKTGAQSNFKLCDPGGGGRKKS